MNKKYKVKSEKGIGLPRATARQSGFTLVETLIALSIFTTSLLGLMVISSQGISGTNFARNQLTASYLAEEGIEYVRVIRDSEYVANPAIAFEEIFSVTHPLGNCANKNCAIAVGTGACPAQTCMGQIKVKKCLNNTCEVLYRNSQGFYNYTDLGNTGFTRTIRIDLADPGDNLLSADEARITSTVTWQEGLATKTVSLTENLFGWQ